MLLRFLEGGELRPVGSTRMIRADVRVIAATNRDLGEAIRRREFREGLYHRLSDVVLINGKFDLAVEGVAPDALRLMMTHGWPGNVRGLEKVLTEAMLLREVGWVEPADLRIADDARPGQPAEAGETAMHPVPLVGAPLPADKRREAALRMAREQGAVNRRQLAARCRVSGETARVELGLRAKLGLLRPVGRGSATRYVLARRDGVKVAFLDAIFLAIAHEALTHARDVHVLCYLPGHRLTAAERRELDEAYGDLFPELVPFFTRRGMAGLMDPLLRACGIGFWGLLRRPASESGPSCEGLGGRRRPDGAVRGGA